MIGLLSTEGNKMNNIQINLEKSIDSILEHLKRYPEYDAFEHSYDMDRKRQLELEALQIKINDILVPLGSKIQLIKNNEICNIFDFKQFKREMINIQENIQILKYETKAKIELLEKEILTVSEDIHFYNEKLLDWAEPIKTNLNSNLFKPKTIKNRHTCKEVKQFMDFLHANGGHENGWRKEDHQLFLKLRNKYENIDLLVKSLHDKLPDISIQEIEQHEEWYNRYLNLQKKKKEAIKFWRNTKAANKTSLMKPYNNIPSKIINVLEKPEGNIRDKLIKWKTEREEKLKCVKELQICEEQKRKKMEILKKKQREELKKVVQEWKESKQTMEQQEMCQRKLADENEKRKRAAEANKLIKQFQSQDDMYILKMRRQKKKEIAPQIRSKSSCIAKKDPERLLKPTRQWINRVHDENCYTNEFSAVMDLRSIPEWRRQL